MLSIGENQGYCLAKSPLTSAQNLIEMTHAVVVGMSKGRDWRSLVNLGCK